MKRQRGVAIILMVLLLATMAGSLMLAAGGPGNDESRTDRSLVEARQALMAYALQSHSSGVQLQRVRLGELPCPDGDGDGRIDVVEDYAGSHCRHIVGWFPWRSLGTPPLVDGSGSRLWYAVAPGWHNQASGSEPALYPGYAERLWLDGVAGVAWVGAPGVPVQGENRQPAIDGVPEMGRYLELEALAGQQWQRHSDGNDRFLLLQAEPILGAVEQRALATLSAWLNRFFGEYGHYPDAADAPGTSCQPGLVEGYLPVRCPETQSLSWPDSNEFEAWLVRNRWTASVSYRRDSAIQARLDGEWHSISLAGGKVE